MMTNIIDIMELKIIKIGTLYFVPVNQSTRSLDLTDFDNSERNFVGQLELISGSGNDQFHKADNDHHWVVANIPALKNGDTRDADDIVNELEGLMRYLFGKGLVPNMDFPGLIFADPFSLTPQMA